MSLKSAKGNAQAQFNNAAKQKQTQTHQKAQQPAPSPQMNGPTPPTWVRNAVDKQVQQQNLQKLSHKVKTKNDFAKAAHNGGQQKSNSLKSNFKTAARSR